jgi:hypothetical protein
VETPGPNATGSAAIVVPASADGVAKTTAADGTGTTSTKHRSTYSSSSSSSLDPYDKASKRRRIESDPVTATTTSADMDVTSSKVEAPSTSTAVKEKQTDDDVSAGDHSTTSTKLNTATPLLSSTTTSTTIATNNEIVKTPPQQQSYPAVTPYDDEHRNTANGASENIREKTTATYRAARFDDITIPDIEPASLSATTTTSTTVTAAAAPATTTTPATSISNDPYSMYSYEDYPNTPYQHPLPPSYHLPHHQHPHAHAHHQHAHQYSSHQYGVDVAALADNDRHRQYQQQHLHHAPHSGPYSSALSSGRIVLNPGHDDLDLNMVDNNNSNSIMHNGKRTFVTPEHNQEAFDILSASMGGAPPSPHYHYGQQHNNNHHRHRQDSYHNNAHQLYHSHGIDNMSINSSNRNTVASNNKNTSSSITTPGGGCVGDGPIIVDIMTTPATKRVYTGKKASDRKQLQSKAWYDRFEELKEYKKQHGDCLVPQKYPTNPRYVVDIRIYI